MVGGDRRIPGVYWPASLTEEVSSRFIRRCCLVRHEGKGRQTSMSLRPALSSQTEQPGLHIKTMPNNEKSKIIKFN